MRIIIQLLLGALSCIVLIVLARRMRPEHELRLYAVSLIIAALIYMGLAARGASLRWLVLELTGVLVFTLFAVLGLKMSAWILALGWALHAAWDAILHKLTEAAFVPQWYPLVCLSFDLFLAGYIIVRARRNAFRRAV
jgi:hypothetical protein